MSVMISRPVGLPATLVPGSLINRAAAWSMILLAPRAHVGSQGYMVSIWRPRICAVLLSAFATKMLHLSPRQVGRPSEQRWISLHVRGPICRQGNENLSGSGRWMIERSREVSISHVTCVVKAGERGFLPCFIPCLHLVN